MGTNYYLRTSPCPHCGHQKAELHIGKSSSGWNFALRVYFNDDGIHDEQLKPFGVPQIRELDDWRPLLAKFPICDEYGKPVATEDMLKEITQRAHPHGLLSHLTTGPRLHPHALNDLKAGAGTYDLCNYEFS